MQGKSTHAKKGSRRRCQENIAISEFYTIVCLYAHQNSRTHSGRQLLQLLGHNSAPRSPSETTSAQDLSYKPPEAFLRYQDPQYSCCCPSETDGERGSKQRKFVREGFVGVFRAIWRVFVEILPSHKSQEKRRKT